MSLFSTILDREETEEEPTWKIEHPTWRFDHHAAGLKTAATNKQRYGLNYYEQIGRKGGKISRGGGFAISHEFAVEAGRKGGKASRKAKVKS